MNPMNISDKSRKKRIHSVLPGFKSRFLSEPLPERLQSLEISRALWLVKFAG
jgi:hypothetical protein